MRYHAKGRGSNGHRDVSQIRITLVEKPAKDVPNYIIIIIDLYRCDSRQDTTHLGFPNEGIVVASEKQLEVGVESAVYVDVQGATAVEVDDDPKSPTGNVEAEGIYDLYHNL